MDRTERFYKINQLLDNARCVSFEHMREACEVSRATLQRDLEYMRTRLNAPILYDRERNGYCLSREAPQVGAQYELPGLWFNSQEIHALLTMQHRRDHRARGLAAAPDALPRELVPGRVVPYAR